MEPREPETLKTLGIIGIPIEALRIISSWRKIFTQITLILILPFSFIFLVCMIVSDYILVVIHKSTEIQSIIRSNIDNAQIQNLQAGSLLGELFGYWVFAITYNLLLIIISLIATSAIVYTVACVYIDVPDINIDKVLNVVPMVWNRLMKIFLWNVILQFGYASVTSISINLILIIINLFVHDDFHNNSIEEVLMTIYYIIYIGGSMYITVIWHLACVVSILEEDYCGIEAMKRSKSLIKGKLWVSFVIFSILYGSLITIESVPLMFKFVNPSTSMALVVLGKVMYAIFSFFVIMLLMLVGLVVQSVIYFVCKSYRNETIDKAALEKQLKYYVGDYVSLDDLTE